MTEQVTVRKLDAEGTEVFRYSGQIIRRTETGVILEAIFDMQEIGFPGLVFRSGDRFVENHFHDRWYNVLAVHDVDTGEPKGWYCNITRPAQIEDGVISAEDLALDLVVYLDGSWIVLDEDEFEALKLNPADRANAQAALQELQSYAERLDGPFVVDARA
jgi:predicted RNA-binding protein associated with RNAse of E/G family